jgi:hypothetical protein
MDLSLTTCPKCGGTATLLQTRDGFEDVTDLGRPTESVRVQVKIEEFRCQEQTCEYEFEKIIREPSA